MLMQVTSESRQDLEQGRNGAQSDDMARSGSEVDTGPEGDSVPPDMVDGSNQVIMEGSQPD